MDFKLPMKISVDEKGDNIKMRIKGKYLKYIVWPIIMYQQTT